VPERGNRNAAEPGVAADGSSETKSQDARYGLANRWIGRDHPFGVQLTQWDMQRPDVGADLPQTVQAEVKALANAHSGKAEQA